MAGTPTDLAAVSALRPLVERGLLIEAFGDVPPQAACLTMPPRANVLDRDVEGAGGSLLVALSWQAAMSLRLRLRPLWKIIARLESRKRRLVADPSVIPHSDWRSVVSTVLRLERYWSSTDRCLLQSLALADRLIGQGYPAILVFGVRANPFSAHCWAQLGDTVLNDSVDHARIYTPILVI